MSFIELAIISIGLAMDAFAVSVCKGLSMKKLELKKSIIIGTYFGLFQGLMPVIGFLCGVRFQSKIINIDHWIAFILLSIIGIKMLIEALKKEESNIDDSVSLKKMIVLAIATSIDALAIGVTFAFLNVNIILAALTIAVITFQLSIIGVKIGNVFGKKYKAKAEIAGGIILVIMGVKILIEHLLA